MFNPEKGLSPEGPGEIPKSFETPQQSEETAAMGGKEKPREVIKKMEEEITKLEKAVGTEAPEIFQEELKAIEGGGVIGRILARVERLEYLLQERFPEAFLKHGEPPEEISQIQKLQGRVELLTESWRLVEVFRNGKRIEEDRKERFMLGYLGKKIEQLMAGFEIEKRGVFKKNFRIIDEKEKFLYDEQTGKPLEFKSEEAAKNFLAKKLEGQVREELEKKWQEKEK